MAVARLTKCDNIVALAKALGISRRLLYTWRDDPVDSAAASSFCLIVTCCLRSLS